MELEQIYNELHAYWEKMPEPKKRYTDWHYGNNGVKQAVEGLQVGAQIIWPGFHLKIARLLNERLEVGSFDDCLPDELLDIEQWIREIFIRNREEE